MRPRRRIAIRAEAILRKLSTATFYIRNGHTLRSAWNKAEVTLPS